MSTCKKANSEVQSAVVIRQRHEGSGETPEVGCFNSYVKHFNKYETIGFNSARLVFSYNSMPSVFHGLKWCWQDYFTLQVGKVVEKYQGILIFQAKAGQERPKLDSTNHGIQY